MVHSQYKWFHNYSLAHIFYTKLIIVQRFVHPLFRGWQSLINCRFLFPDFFKQPNFKHILIRVIIGSVHYCFNFYCIQQSFNGWCHRSQLNRSAMYFTIKLVDQVLGRPQFRFLQKYLKCCQNSLYITIVCSVCDRAMNLFFL